MRLVLSMLVCCWMNTSCDEAKRISNNRRFLPPSFAATPPTKIATLKLTSARTCKKMTNRLNTVSKQALVAIADGADIKELVPHIAFYSYIIGAVYDCNMQQQAKKGGIEFVKENKRKATYRACYEQADDDKRFVRYVDWSEHKSSTGEIPVTNGEAKQIDGKMIDIDADSKIRIELVKNRNKRIRELTTYFWTASNKIAEAALRSHLVEHDNGNTKEHLLGLRYYNEVNSSDKIWLLLAHLQKTASAMMLASCTIESGEDYNKSCTNASFDMHYFDDDGKEITRNKPVNSFKNSVDAFLKNITDKWTHSAYNVTKLDPLTPFFTGGADTAENRIKTIQAGLPDSCDAD